MTGDASGADADYVGPPFADVANPSHEEIRAWAYSNALQPMQDWDIMIAFPEYLDVLMDLVRDRDCPTRSLFVASLYCLIGHSDLADPRVREAVSEALASDDPWLSTWGERALGVLDAPESLDRGDWCGWDGLRKTPGG